jgi:hypothetical protein
VKKTNIKPAKKTIRPAALQELHKKRAAIKYARPLHKRVLLHPFTVMVLLCAGVLIVGSTIQSFAASYNVTASVPAPLITHPALITAPSNLTHVHGAAVTITGSCQAQSYVKVSVNASLGGAAPCDSNQTFSVPTTLSAGANQLQAQIYNLTDQPGPTSNATVIYLDQNAIIPPPAPAASPTTLHLTDVEGDDYAAGNRTWQTSVNPTISGTAPPFAYIVVTFHSVVQTCRTQADANGWWSCTLNNTLPVGIHHVDVVATTAQGQTFTAPTFQINVVAGRTSILRPMTSTAPRISFDHVYQARRAGQAAVWNVSITGGTAPYKLTISWGDGTTENLARPDGSSVGISHVYTATSNNYLVTATVTDAKNTQSKVQVVTAINLVLTNTASVLAGGNHNPFGSLLASTRQRLWLIWPAYIVVVLMAVGYYLGEREEYRRLALIKHVPRTAGRRK